MTLYIINPNIQISNKLAKFLLENLTEYKHQSCNIVEINDQRFQQNNINLKYQNYLGKFTIGKLKFQLNDECINEYDDDIIYYLIQTKKAKAEDYIYIILA